MRYTVEAPEAGWRGRRRRRPASRSRGRSRGAPGSPRSSRAPASALGPCATFSYANRYATPAPRSRSPISPEPARTCATIAASCIAALWRRATAVSSSVAASAGSPRLWRVAFIARTTAASAATGSSGSAAARAGRGIASSGAPPAAIVRIATTSVRAPSPITSTMYARAPGTKSARESLCRRRPCRAGARRPTAASRTRARRSPRESVPESTTRRPPGPLAGTDRATPCAGT